MDPLIARKTWRTLEPIHGMIYFVPEGPEEYAGVGIADSRMGYFASRSAAMGPVPAEVVIATFFNFNPTLIESAIPEAWNLASPDQLLAARTRAVDRALRRGLGSMVESAELVEAAELARAAAEAAGDFLAGRPLFAGHARLPWPDQPHLVLWHAQTLLREYRGDGHIAALVAAGLDPVEALVTHAAAGEVDVTFLRISRAWPDEEWSAALHRLRSRGILDSTDPLAFTEAGRDLRQEVEDRTDASSAGAYAVLGEEGCERLRQLGRPISKAVIAAGLLRFPQAGAQSI